MTSKKSSRKNSMTPASGSLMFEGHSAIMLLIEPETGIILDANQSAADFYGYSKSKLCDMSINEINTLPPEQLQVEIKKALCLRTGAFAKISKNEICDKKIYACNISILEAIIL